VRRLMLNLVGDGPLDGFPLTVLGEPEELHIAYTDEMLRLRTSQMSAEDVEHYVAADETRLAFARGVAIYVRDKSELSAADSEKEGLPGLYLATYVFQETLSPQEYQRRRRLEKRNA